MVWHLIIFICDHMKQMKQMKEMKNMKETPHCSYLPWSGLSCSSFAIIWSKWKQKVEEAPHFSWLPRSGLWSSSFAIIWSKWRKWQRWKKRITFLNSPGMEGSRSLCSGGRLAHLDFCRHDFISISLFLSLPISLSDEGGGWHTYTYPAMLFSHSLSLSVMRGADGTP